MVVVDQGAAGEAELVHYEEEEAAGHAELAVTGM